MNLQFEDTQKPAEVKLTDRAKSSSCGKAILIGEHSVVYGTHAIALPLKQMRMYFEIEPLKNKTETQIQLKLGGQEASSRLTDVIPEAIELLGQKPFAMQASGHSSLPIGAGLGSSASLCVAILRALAQCYQLELSQAELSKLSNKLEARFHGTPSGLDAAVVAYESCIYFAKDSDIEAIQLNSGEQAHWEFLLIDSKCAPQQKQ